MDVSQHICQKRKFFLSRIYFVSCSIQQLKFKKQLNFIRGAQSKEINRQASDQKSEFAADASSTQATSSIQHREHIRGIFEAHRNRRDSKDFRPAFFVSRTDHGCADWVLFLIFPYEMVDIIFRKVYKDHWSNWFLHTVFSLFCIWFYFMKSGTFKCIQ